MPNVKYYAHTAEGPDGLPLPEDSGRWQLLSAHLRNVADLARCFAEPLSFVNEAELASGTQPPGLFTLAAPTGSGKTLSWLALPFIVAVSIMPPRLPSVTPILIL